MRERIAVAVTALGLVAAACAGQRPTPQGQPQSRPQQAAGTLQVKAEEYKFDGVPGSLPAGEATFVLENVGQEDHEIGMVKIKGDIPVTKLIRLPGNQSDRYIAEDVGHAFAKPGNEATFEAQLTPGRYGYACFVEAPDGEPHAMKGMFGEFTVE